MKKVDDLNWITKTMDFDFDLNDDGRSRITRLEENTDPIRQAGFIKEAKQSILLGGGATIKFEKSEIIKFEKKNIISDPGDEVSHLYQNRGNDKDGDICESPQDPNKYIFKGKEYSNVEIPYIVDKAGEIKIDTFEMMDSVDFQKQLHAIRTSPMYAEIRKKEQSLKKILVKF